MEHKQINKINNNNYPEVKSPLDNSPVTLKNILNSTIREFLDRDDVENINIDKPKLVYIQNIKGEYERHERPDLNLDLLDRLAREIATSEGMDFNDIDQPLSTKLMDGTRVEISMSSSVISGFTMAMRKRRKNFFTLENFGFSEDEAKFLEHCVKERKTILISGGTSSGKTTVLECLGQFIEPERRIITIQDPVEIDFINENKTDFTLTATDFEKRNSQLMAIAASSMRLNPESVIFGEIREKYMAYAFRQLINTGHDGSMATIHANNSDEALNRLSNLAHQQEGGDRMIILDELKNTIDIGIHVKKNKAGKRIGTITKYKQ